MTLSLEKLPKTIKGISVQLRLLHPDNAAAFYAMTNVPEIATIISFLSYPVDPAFPLQWIEKNNGTGDRIYGIFENEKIIGQIGAHLNTNHETEIGYWVGPDAMGKGIASNAVKLLLESLIETYPDCTIFAECLPDNVGSLRVLEKNGFTLAGKPGKRENRIRLEYSRT